MSFKRLSDRGVSNTLCTQFCLHKMGIYPIESQFHLEVNKDKNSRLFERLLF